MAKEKKEESLDIILDEETINKPVEKTPIPKDSELFPEEETEVTRLSEERSSLVNCLTNEIVIVRFIAKARGNITDPKHVLFGNMAPRSKVKFPVPMLRSGQYADVLTKEEKKFLEWKLGLEPNALSVYNRKNKRRKINTYQQFNWGKSCNNS